MSTASRVLIGVGMAIVVGIAYYRYNLLTEDLPSDQLALARLGLDKHPGIGFLSNEKVRDLKPTRRYRNINKPLIEDPLVSEEFRDIFKIVEKIHAEKFANAIGIGSPCHPSK